MTDCHRVITEVSTHARWLGIVAGAVAIACTSGSTSLPPTPRPITPAEPSPPKPAPRPAPRPVPTATATAIIHDLAGGRVGVVTLADSYAGVIIAGTVTGLGLGAHGVHIHEVGKCEPPFASAGAHFNPDKKRHGFRNSDGPHAGDLPIIDMPAAGRLHFEFLLPGTSLKGTNALLGSLGTSIVFHSSRDDYVSDPAGNSGPRLACGVIVGEPKPA